MTTTMRWTVSAVEALPDRLDDTRYEIIDGELHVSTQPHWHHQRSCTRVLSAFLGWDPQSRRGQVTLAPGVIFAEDEAAAPDVVWISNERLNTALGEDGKLHQPPELMVEVLSPGATNERRDRESKLLMYSRRGVDEYWILDWRKRIVDVYRRREHDLRHVATLADTDTLTSPLLPDFSTPVAQLFGEPPSEVQSHGDNA
jgi:Uma2 family endonuclease